MLMEVVNDFKYYTDKQGNAHSAGYLFNEQCMKENTQSGGGKSLAIPGGLFWGSEIHPPKHKCEKKGLINEILFDKLFSCGCVEEKSGKHTRKRKMSSKKKTRRV
jgi:hypothetical protein